MALNLLYLGPLDGTCAQRAAALRELGHDVTHLDIGEPRTFWKFQVYRAGNRLGRPPDLLGSNRGLIAAMREQRRDILWIDKGRTIRPGTLARARALAPDTVFAAYSPDDMHNPANQSAQYLGTVPLYDLHVTTKSYNIDELREMGATDVFFVDNAYDPATHRPLELSQAERDRFEAGVGFVGSYEEERAGFIRRQRPARGAARPGIRQGDQPTAINLGFLRKVNRDLQTTRTMEIPACRAFMLAERTDEHRRLFEEGVEAEYFDSFEELLSKCRYYLEHDDEQRAIARRGYDRCIRDGYGNQHRMKQILDYLQARYPRLVR